MNIIEIYGYGSIVVCAVVGEHMSRATESALEDLGWLDLHAFGALVDLVPDHLTALAHNNLQRRLRQFLEQNLSVFEILFHKYLGVVVGAPAAFLAVPVHIVPAQFSHDVLVLAQFT